MAGEQPNEGLSGSCPEFNSLGRAAALTKTSSGFHPSQSEHSGECWDSPRPSPVTIRLYSHYLILLIIITYFKTSRFLQGVSLAVKEWSSFCVTVAASFPVIPYVLHQFGTSVSTDVIHWSLNLILGSVLMWYILIFFFLCGWSVLWPVIMYPNTDRITLVRFLLTWHKLET